MTKNLIKSTMIGLSLLALGMVGGKAQGSNSTLTKELVLKTGTFQSLIKTGLQTTNYTYTLPITTPTANQVLTATAVSGTDVTLGWSSTSGGIMYGPSGMQNTLTPVTTKLFDVGYASASGNAAGAQITSSTTLGTAVGLQVNSSGTTSVIGAMFSATGGSANYALIVPANSGSVGIGNAAPGSLLSVGSSGQLTVNTSGNLSTSGTVVVTGATLSMGPATTAPEIRFYEPSGSGTDYSSMKAQAQSASVNYILPQSAPSGTDRALVVNSIAGSDVTLKWSSTSIGTSALTITKVSKVQSTSTNVYADVKNMSFTVAANSVYKFEMMVAFLRSVDKGENDVDVKFSFPSGTATYTQIRVRRYKDDDGDDDDDDDGHKPRFKVRREQASAITNSLLNIKDSEATWLYSGILDVGNTGGTFQMAFRNVTNSGTVDILPGSYIIYSKLATE